MTMIAVSPGIYETMNRTHVGFGIESRLIDEVQRPSDDTSKLFWLRFADDAAAETRQQIADLADLPYDWDGFDAPPLSPQIIQKAQSSLERFVEESRRSQPKWINPDVFPTSMGEIYFHWDLPKLKFSIIVAESDDLTILISDGTSRAIRYSVNVQEGAKAVASLQASVS